MSNQDAVPDARHLIWVARNLLWQAHEGMAARFQNKTTLKQRALCNEVKEIIDAIDWMRERLQSLGPVPCLHTTMPPCTENAWESFLGHVQACYLSQKITHE